MNRRLAEAVIAAFQDSAEGILYARLAVFDERAWRESYSWLDASGLVLYFLQRIKSLKIESAIPVKVLERFDKNATDNRDRTADIFAEFIRINRAFQDAGLSYVNLKGFTLVPGACSDAALRCQFDLDFSMFHGDVGRCEEILKQNGYWLAGANDNVREFRAGSRQLPSVRDLYKANSQRCLEVHFVGSAIQEAGLYTDKPISTQRRSWNGLTFPVLSECGKFIAQALHLFKHLRSEWTRISWILEYASYVNFHRENDVLWSEVSKNVSQDPEAMVALGAATLIADQTFGIVSVPPILASAADNLPIPVRLWIERYGSKVMTAKFPGTKFYLLLEKALDEGSVTKSSAVRGKLIPFHRPRRIVSPSAGERWPQLAKTYLAQHRYNFFRLRFHLVNGFSYMIEVPLWKRHIARQQS
jgi:Uncharacterised nucleotidyltransferase